MLVVHVHVKVKPEYVEAFKVASGENVRLSRMEPGIARFDLLQSEDTPARFVLVEAYHSEAAAVEHKSTMHYAMWRETVAEMMAEPRQSLKYSDAFPLEMAF
jgi:quinol monooxygenase YgiN